MHAITGREDGWKGIVQKEAVVDAAKAQLVAGGVATVFACRSYEGPNPSDR